MIRAAKSTIVAFQLVLAVAAVADAGQKNTPETGCDRWAAWCLYQKDAYLHEDEKVAARRAAETQVGRSPAEQTRR
jgi:hypothetical protein